MIRFIVTVTTLFLTCNLCESILQAKLQVGDTCDPNNFQWYAVENDPYHFLYCDTISKTLQVNQCPEVNEVKLHFDQKQNRCVGPRSRNKRTAGIPKSSNVGEACSFATDCKDNMFCPSGTCQCNPGYVGTSGASSCLPTINPGQSGCTQNIQCTGGWPGSTCVNGACNCPTTYSVAQTQDGFICYKTGSCPLPDYPTQNTLTTIDQLVGTPPSTADPCIYLSNDDGTGANGGTAAAANYCNSGADPGGFYQGDMYDCIPTTAPPAATNQAGVCCPSRALTCILPKMVNTAIPPITPTETRYWYNSITQGCEPFSFNPDANQGNANSFLTLDFCLSYCASACDHAPPRLNLATTTSANRVTSCTSSSDCAATTTGSSYTCTQTGTTRTCCASPSFVCTVRGGRQVYGQTNGPTLPTAADTGTVSNPVLPANLATRWYYDSTTQTCTSFTYQGNAGNWNNFLSQSDCQTFCISAVCDQGSPLKTSLGTNQACSGGTGCPTTYECRSNVCCPRKQTVCIQPKNPGTGTSNSPAYWFNAATGDCESFTYTGSGGNDNNFLSYAACIAYCGNIRGEPRCIQGDADKDSTGKYLTCSSTGTTSSCRANYECYFDGTLFGCCPTQSWTCQLQRNLGSVCINAGARWYYDTTTRTCQAFTYNGCDGNSNNFITRDDCERFCGAGGCPYGGQPFVDTSTSTRRVCGATGTTCPSGYECQSITIASALQNSCCFSRITICQLNPQQGSTTGAATTRYYFNPSSRSCQSFSFFGSGGNLNNFATLSQCTNFCSSSACNLGETVAIDQTTQRVQTCNQQIASTCSAGYQCRQDTLFNRFVCCGSTDMGVCPTGEKAFIDAFTQAPRECRVGVTGDCYTNFLCRPNSVRNRNYCCAPAAGTYCPAGRAVGRDTVTQQPQTCFISTVNTCNSGYSCQSTTTGQVQGFCCTINPLCSNSGTFAVDGNQNPVTCTIQTTPITNPCGTGFTCQTTTNGSTSGYCCSTGTTTVCGTLTPVVDPATNNPRICSGTAPCSTGSCTLNVQSGISYCCTQGTVPVDPDGCGIGLIAYRETTTSVIRQCVIGPGSNCPPGFSCQLSTTTNQNQCCGLSAGCPTNSAAFVSQSTGSAQSCAAGGTPCPTGFSCTTTTTGSVCCSNGQPITIVTTPAPTVQPSVRCPLSTQTPYIPAGSTTPQRCNPGPCPANYQCVNNGQQFICCSTQANMCPSGSVVATNVATGAAINCMTATCPSGYRCTYSASYRWYFCCSGGGTVTTVAPSTSGCPNNQQAYFTPGSPTPARCTQGINTGVGACPSLYSCTFSTTYSTTICCRQSSLTGASSITSTATDCPSGGNVYLYPGTQLPLTCTDGNDTRCPAGFRCTRVNGSFQCFKCG